MLGISWYEFLVVLLISFICLKPSDFRKIIVAIRDITNFFNSLIRDITTTVEKSIALDDLKIDDFFVIDKEIKNKDKHPQNIKDAEIVEINQSDLNNNKKSSFDKADSN